MDRFADLFNRWRNSKEEYKTNFAEDGIIDELKWTNSPKKILIILKETNNFKDDLRTLIRKGYRSYLWHNLGRWIYGIQNTTRNFIPSRSDADKHRDEALLSSAIINLKKSSGNSGSDMEEIKKYALEDANFIREEFDLIDPEIIICGYTFGIVKEIFENKFPSVDYENRIMTFDNKMFFNYWHPAAHYPADMSYYTLCALFQRNFRESELSN